MVKRFRVAPGVRLNVNKKSVSGRVGGRRRGVTFGSGRRRSGGCLGAFLALLLFPTALLVAIQLLFLDEAFAESPAIDIATPALECAVLATNAEEPDDEVLRLARLAFATYQEAFASSSAGERESDIQEMFGGFAPLVQEMGPDFWFGIAFVGVGHDVAALLDREPSVQLAQEQSGDVRAEVRRVSQRLYRERNCAIIGR